MVQKWMLEKSLVCKLTVQMGIKFPSFMHLGSSHDPATGPVLLQHTVLAFTTGPVLLQHTVLTFTTGPVLLQHTVLTFTTGPVLLQHTVLTFTTYFSFRSIHIFSPYCQSCSVSMSHIPPFSQFPSAHSCYQTCVFQATRFDCPEWHIRNTVTGGGLAVWGRFPAEAGIFVFASTSRAEECVCVLWYLNSIQRDLYLF